MEQLSCSEFISVSNFGVPLLLNYATKNGATKSAITVIFGAVPQHAKTYSSFF